MCMGVYACNVTSGVESFNQNQQAGVGFTMCVREVLCLYSWWNSA